MKVVVVGVVTLGLPWATQAFAPIPSFGHPTTKNHNVARYATTGDSDGPRNMGGYLDGLSSLPSTETKWKVSEKEEKTEMGKDSVVVEASTATTEKLVEETKDTPSPPKIEIDTSKSRSQRIMEKGSSSGQLSIFDTSIFPVLFCALVIIMMCVYKEYISHFILVIS
jgi:hypothetical protein